MVKPRRKTKPGCREGHPMTAKNTVDCMSRGRPFKRCRICRNAYMKAYEKAKRARLREKAQWTQLIGWLESLKSENRWAKIPPSLVARARAALAVKL